MLREVQKYLYDIQESIDSIFEYLGEERDYVQFKDNKLLQRGIERELEIIGEASNRILKLETGIAITNARRIVDMRNWVIHGYDKFDPAIVWGIISKDLPTLRGEVALLLEDPLANDH